MHTELPIFTETRAFENLVLLAEKPYDLTRPSALLERGRLTAYSCRSRLLNLHYATQRVDDAVLAELQNLADELQLVEQFKAMRRGAVLNRIDGHESENRQVLHTACRDIFDALPAFPEASSDAKREIEKLKIFLAEIEGKKEKRDFLYIQDIKNKKSH
jgi:glucose-6-phosphate isomerase